jgi:hypothetical protein
MFPELPEVPPEQRGTAHAPLRYEDVTQDGRIVLTALPHHMSLTVFQGLLVKNEVARHNAHAGIVPIISRLVIENGTGPVSVRKPVTSEGGYWAAHTVDETGAVNRILLNMWADVTAPLGRTHLPRPANAGQPVRIGRVFSEHVFTRLFAPRAERKVTRFDLGPWPEVPPMRQEWRRPEAILELPDGGALDAELVPDELPIVFGLGHTDSNQHVNSLVYPRLFEEAALRRLAAHGRPTTVLARAVEIAYRKPCFAGQRMRIWLRAHATGAVGVFRPEGEPEARPHVVVRMEFSEEARS